MADCGVLAVGDGHMFQALLKKRAIDRAYDRIVDDCLAVLFCGFPPGLLPALRRRANISGLVRRGQAEGNSARACSVQVAVLLSRKIIGHLNKREREELAQAFLHNEASNPTYKGFKYLFQVAEQFNVSPALVSYLTTEVAGQLRGMSQKAIFNSWVDAQIGGAMGQLRERIACRDLGSGTSALPQRAEMPSVEINVR
jgi:hypothetical protein